MAAIAYPYRAPIRAPRRGAFDELGEAEGPGLFLLEPSPHPLEPRAAKRGVATRRGTLARPLAGLVSVLVLVATYFGAGLLVGAHQVPHGTLPGAHAVSGGYAYVVQSGDTLWSIVTRLDPSSDPRPLVAELTARLHGAEIQVGERIVVPLS